VGFIGFIVFFGRALVDAGREILSRKTISLTEDL